MFRLEFSYGVYDPDGEQAVVSAPPDLFSIKDDAIKEGIRTATSNLWLTFVVVPLEGENVEREHYSGPDWSRRDA